MEESAIKGMKSLELKDIESSSSDAAIREIRIIVEGYDNSLGEDELKSALTRHFSSCGEIKMIISPSYACSAKDIINRSIIYILGEGAEKKALELSGSDMGGWNVVVEPFPFQPGECLPARTKSSISRGWITVTGYDTSLPEGDIKRALIKHFSSFGEIEEIILQSGPGVKSGVLITGEKGALNKALSGCGSECDVKGCKIVAKKFILPKRYRNQIIGGYTIPARCTKKAKMTTE